MQKTTVKSIRVNREAVKEAISLALHIAACALIYKLAHDAATARRGYEAIGSEPVLALIPLVVYYVRNRK